MIGADSNILVRLFVDDDQHQHALARQFIDSRTPKDPVFVSAVVIAELVWALEQIYGYGRQQILAALALLAGSADVVLEYEDLISAAMAHSGASNADVADCIIAAIAERAGASTTFTFDRQAAKRIPAMTLLK